MAFNFKAFLKADRLFDTGVLLSLASGVPFVGDFIAKIAGFGGYAVGGILIAIGYVMKLMNK